MADAPLFRAGEIVKHDGHVVEFLLDQWPHDVIRASAVLVDGKRPKRGTQVPWILMTIARQRIERRASTTGDDHA